MPLAATVPVKGVRVKGDWQAARLVINFLCGKSVDVHFFPPMNIVVVDKPTIAENNDSSLYHFLYKSF